MNSLTDDKQMAKDKRGSAIRPLSINQVQRIVGREDDKMMIEGMNNAPQQSNNNLQIAGGGSGGQTGTSANLMLSDVKRRE